MGLVVGSHFDVGDVGGFGSRFANLLEHRVAKNLARLLLDRGVFVETLASGVVGQKDDVNHLLEELLAALRGLVSHAVERIHVGERRDEVTGGDGASANTGEDARALRGRQAAVGGGHGTGIGGRGLARAAGADGDGHGQREGASTTGTAHRPANTTGCRRTLPRTIGRIGADDDCVWRGVRVFG